MGRYLEEWRDIDTNSAFQKQRNKRTAMRNDSEISIVKTSEISSNDEKFNMKMGGPKFASNSSYLHIFRVQQDIDPISLHAF